MHLVDEVVERIGQPHQTGCVAAADPRMGTRPRVTLNENDLRGAGRSDTVYSSLVESEDVGVFHGVVFVVGIKNDTCVVLVSVGNLDPPGLECGMVSNDLAAETTIVMWVNDSIGTLSGDVVDDVVETSEVGLVEWAGQTTGARWRVSLHPGKTLVHVIINLLETKLHSWTHLVLIRKVLKPWLTK